MGWEKPFMPPARTETVLSSSKLLAHSGSRLEIKTGYKNSNSYKNGKGLSQAIVW